ncbi:RDD family protein [Paenibacillus motobuensis]|uniref:RDD family protein n=1 Tax=Paenibacillus TaxID=44249 RepID=UPI002041D9E6|nr:MULTISPECIES: RDD family protein [Paenibacillus]MCM3038679.1 RDD family protein [Paenibacillus lutimineralis]MCM3645783.1 RDD family protein [Paenibacillus motobuensis]
MGAGFWVRFGALLIDSILIGILVAMVSLLITGGSDDENVKSILRFLYSLLLPIFWGGYTVGKRLCGIKIRKIDDQTPPGLGTMLLRNILAGLIYALTLGIGLIISAFMVGMREDRRAIHDFIAGTEVIHDK